MTKITSPQSSKHPIADTVTASYAREHTKVPCKEASPWQWVNELCVAVALAIVLVSTTLASMNAYRSLIGAHLPSHVGAAIEKKS